MQSPILEIRTVTIIGQKWLFLKKGHQTGFSLLEGMGEAPISSQNFAHCTLQEKNPPPPPVDSPHQIFNPIKTSFLAVVIASVIPFLF